MRPVITRCLIITLLALPVAALASPFLIIDGAPTDHPDEYAMELCEFLIPPDLYSEDPCKAFALVKLCHKAGNAHGVESRNIIESVRRYAYDNQAFAKVQNARQCQVSSASLSMNEHSEPMKTKKAIASLNDTYGN